MDDVKKEKAKIVLLSSIAVLDIITNLAVLKKRRFSKEKAPKKIDPNVTAAILNSIINIRANTNAYIFNQFRC